MRSLRLDCTCVSFGFLVFAAACSGGNSDGLDESLGAREAGTGRPHDGATSTTELDGGDEPGGDDAGEPVYDADGPASDAGPALDASDETATFVSPDGDDTSPGTRAAPLRTLARAVSVGNDVVLLDGVFSASSQAAQGSDRFPLIDVPSGVHLRADTIGGAVIEGRVDTSVRADRRGLAFLGDGGAHGIVFRGFTQAISALTGSISLSDLHFEALSATALDLSGDADVQLTTTSTDSYTDAASLGVALVTDDARLTVTGGRVEGGTPSSSCSVMFVVHDRAKLVLSDLTLANSPLGAAATGGTAEVTLHDVEIDSLGTAQNCAGVFYLNGTDSTLTMTDTHVLNSAWNAIANNSNTAHVTLTRTTIVGSGNDGVSLYASSARPGSGSFSASDSQFGGSTLGGLTLVRLEDVSLDGVTIEDNGRDGLELQSVTRVHVRGTSVQRNGWAGVSLVGAAAGAELDFGTLASPGGNTFVGNFLARASGQDKNFYNQTTAGVLTYAVGNTWNPVQGADSSGHYSATGAGAVRDALNTDAVGGNYAVAAGGGALRLAQNP